MIFYVGWLAIQNKRYKESNTIGQLNAPQHPPNRTVHGEKNRIYYGFSTPLPETNPLLVKLCAMGMALLESGGRQVWVSSWVALAVSPAPHSTTRAEKKEDDGGGSTACGSTHRLLYCTGASIISDKHEPPNATKSAGDYGRITRNHPRSSSSCGCASGRGQPLSLHYFLRRIRNTGLEG